MDYMLLKVRYLQIKLKTCGKYSKKRCIVFLLFYSMCIIFLSSYLKDKFSMHKQENCTIQSADVLEKEGNLIQEVDTYFEKFFRDTAIEKMPASYKWTQITDNIYVYSAFLEMCPSKLQVSSKLCLKFIAIVYCNITSVSSFLQDVKCILKRNRVISEEEFIFVEILPESHDKLFSAAFLFCPVKDSYPTHASIYQNNSLNLSWLVVENFKLLTNPKLNRANENNLSLQIMSLPQDINLCVRPLYDKVFIMHLIQFLVYYSVMGVDHFIFYYHKSFKSLNTLLKTLKFSNTSSEVLVWDIPLDNDLIHEYGQIAFTQDCLARSKNKFRHSIITDLDEFIVPQAHRDIKSMLSHLDKTYVNAGSYVIPMVLFCNEYSVQNSHVLPFHILNYNKRQETHWYHHYRSKYIVRSDRIRYSGVHFTWELESNYKEVFISPNMALVNHYRFCCGMGQTWFFHLFQFQVLNDKVVVDNTLLSHRDELINNSLFNFVINLPFKIDL